MSANDEEAPDGFEEWLRLQLARDPIDRTKAGWAKAAWHGRDTEVAKLEDRLKARHLFGNITLDRALRRLAVIYYLLARDHLPAGDLEQLVQEVEYCGQPMFSIEHIGDRAWLVAGALMQDGDRVPPSPGNKEAGPA